MKFTSLLLGGNGWNQQKQRSPTFWKENLQRFTGACKHGIQPQHKEWSGISDFQWVTSRAWKWLFLWSWLYPLLVSAKRSGSVKEPSSATLPLQRDLSWLLLDACIKQTRTCDNAPGAQQQLKCRQRWSDGLKRSFCPSFLRRNKISTEI